MALRSPTKKAITDASPAGSKPMPKGKTISQKIRDTVLNLPENALRIGLGMPLKMNDEERAQYELDKRYTQALRKFQFNVADLRAKGVTDADFKLMGVYELTRIPPVPNLAQMSGIGASVPLRMPDLSGPSGTPLTFVPVSRPDNVAAQNEAEVKHAEAAAAEVERVQLMPPDDLHAYFAIMRARMADMNVSRPDTPRITPRGSNGVRQSVAYKAFEAVLRNNRYISAFVDGAGRPLQGSMLLRIMNRMWHATGPDGDTTARDAFRDRFVQIMNARGVDLRGVSSAGRGDVTDIIDRAFRSESSAYTGLEWRRDINDLLLTRYYDPGVAENFTGNSYTDKAIARTMRERRDAENAIAGADRRAIAESKIPPSMSMGEQVSDLGGPIPQLSVDDIQRLETAFRHQGLSPETIRRIIDSINAIAMNESAQLYAEGMFLADARQQAYTNLGVELQRALTESYVSPDAIHFENVYEFGRWVAAEVPKARRVIMAAIGDGNPYERSFRGGAVAAELARNVYRNEPLRAVNLDVQIRQAATRVDGRLRELATEVINRAREIQNRESVPLIEFRGLRINWVPNPARQAEFYIEDEPEIGPPGDENPPPPPPPPPPDRNGGEVQIIYGGRNRKINLHALIALLVLLGYGIKKIRDLITRIQTSSGSEDVPLPEKPVEPPADDGKRPTDFTPPDEDTGAIDIIDSTGKPVLSPTDASSKTNKLGLPVMYQIQITPEIRKSSIMYRLVLRYNDAVDRYNKEAETGVKSAAFQRAMADIIMIRNELRANDLQNKLDDLEYEFDMPSGGKRKMKRYIALTPQLRDLGVALDVEQYNAAAEQYNQLASGLTEASYGNLVMGKGLYGGAEAVATMNKALTNINAALAKAPAGPGPAPAQDDLDAMYDQLDDLQRQYSAMGVKMADATRFGNKAAMSDIYQKRQALAAQIADLKGKIDAAEAAAAAQEPSEPEPAPAIAPLNPGDDQNTLVDMGEGTERVNFVDPAEADLFISADKERLAEQQRWEKYSLVSPGYGLGGPAVNSLQRANLSSERRRFTNCFRPPVSTHADRISARDDRYAVSRWAAQAGPSYAERPRWKPVNQSSFGAVDFENAFFDQTRRSQQIMFTADEFARDGHNFDPMGIYEPDSALFDSFSRGAAPPVDIRDWARPTAYEFMPRDARPHEVGGSSNNASQRALWRDPGAKTMLERLPARSAYEGLSRFEGARR